MNVFGMVLGIVIVTSLASVLNTYVKHRARHHDSSIQNNTGERLDRLEALVHGKLEKRIANLETIVTDQEYDLKRKINEL